MGVVAVGGFCRAMHHWENSNDTASIPLWSVLWRLFVCASVRRFLGVVSRCLCFSGLCKSGVRLGKGASGSARKRTWVMATAQVWHDSGSRYMQVSGECSRLL